MKMDKIAHSILAHLAADPNIDEGFKRGAAMLMQSVGWVPESATMHDGADAIIEAHRIKSEAALAARLREALERWTRLKAELEEIKNIHTAKGTHGRGWADACLEDADTSILMLLEQVKAE
jgi:hypothetical protein